MFTSHGSLTLFLPEKNFQYARPTDASTRRFSYFGTYYFQGKGAGVFRRRSILQGSNCTSCLGGSQFGLMVDSTGLVPCCNMLERKCLQPIPGYALVHLKFIWRRLQTLQRSFPTPNASSDALLKVILSRSIVSTCGESQDYDLKTSGQDRIILRCWHLGDCFRLGWSWVSISLLAKIIFLGWCVL